MIWLFIYFAGCLFISFACRDRMAGAADNYKVAGWIIAIMVWPILLILAPFLLMRR